MDGWCEHDDRVPTNKECGLRAVIGTGRALWSRASSQSMIPPRNVNLAACQAVKMRKTDFPEGPCGSFPARGWHLRFRGKLTLSFVVTRGGMFPSPAIQRARPLAIGRWGALVAPVASLSPRHPFPQGHQPQFIPWCAALLVGDRHFSRWRPRWIALRAWGKRDAKSRGESRRKAGVPY